MITRTDIINYYIKENQYKSYLEIGVASGANYDNIEIKERESVDPAIGAYNSSRPTYMMTSDIFFSTIVNDKFYDIIFIDGLHEYQQVYKDILNSLNQKI